MADMISREARRWTENGEMRMRLIDKDALEEAVQGAINIMETHGISMITASVPLAIIKGAPTIDAVPVVRCKDCKYWYAEIGASTGWLPCQEIATDRDWYCASGKRRDDDGKDA